MRRIVAVIPARMASSRFPGKPLVSISGMPMIEHVRRRVALANAVDDIVVATCDRAILDVVIRAGGKAVMTSDTHERCTERVAEAIKSMDAEVVVMVQGDEPLLLPEAVRLVAAPLREQSDLGCVNLLSPLESDTDYANPNIVKAACAQSGDILFFSRAAIPSYRRRVDCPIYRQTGIMAFTRALLDDYQRMPETPFERAESVDMLRLLEHGRRIHGVTLDCPTVGVDRPEDVPIVERFLAGDAVQRDLFARSREVA
jgi:3-deoxy-manno-octulosonate cytidylyltransferase (CMP-KDO synthetase)